MKPLLICIVFCILQNTIQNTYVFNLIKYSKNCISTIFLISDKKKFEKPIRYICVHICGHICIHLCTHMWTHMYPSDRIIIFDQELILSCFKSKIHFFRFRNMCVPVNAWQGFYKLDLTWLDKIIFFSNLTWLELTKNLFFQTLLDITWQKKFFFKLDWHNVTKKIFFLYCLDLT